MLPKFFNPYSAKHPADAINKLADGINWDFLKFASHRQHDKSTMDESEKPVQMSR